MARILIVEDNAELAAGIRHNLELEGYTVDTALDGGSALAQAAEARPDLVILDLMLPGIDGFEVLEKLRAAGHGAPVLILSARSDERDKVRGFRLDADQYVTKPFRLLELLERVKALLRRAEARTRSAEASRFIRFGDVTVDTESRTTMRRGTVVALTPKAYRLMCALVRRAGAVATRQELLREVWRHRALVPTRTVDSHIAELRRKLEADPASPRHFITVWKVGYRFEA
ncbi:MAG: response regulator transcription factor [Gemmatimonadetes bacterium]|nr:response regulator transcription factor [Gemmatimonadota bacterium]